MILKVCDRCGCEIRPKNNNPGAIKFGWTVDDGKFVNKDSVDAFDMCDYCMQQLVVFLGCEPEKIGVKTVISREEQDKIERRLKAKEQKSAK